MNQKLQSYTVTSGDNETLDCIMYRNGCTHSHNIVMQLNPHLSTLPCVLPRMTFIQLPYNISQAVNSSKKQTINLWS